MDERYRDRSRRSSGFTVLRAFKPKESKNNDKAKQCWPGSGYDPIHRTCRDSTKALYWMTKTQLQRRPGPGKAKSRNLLTHTLGEEEAADHLLTVISVPILQEANIMPKTDHKQQLSITRRPPSLIIRPAEHHESVTRSKERSTDSCSRVSAKAHESSKTAHEKSKARKIPDLKISTTAKGGQQYCPPLILVAFSEGPSA